MSHVVLINLLHRLSASGGRECDWEEEEARRHLDERGGFDRAALAASSRSGGDYRRRDLGPADNR